jgi:hypothetical protein
MPPRRRFPFAFLAVLVVVVATGTAAFVLQDNRHGPDRTDPDPVPTVEVGPIVDDLPSPTASPAPGRSPSAKPRQVPPPTSGSSPSASPSPSPTRAIYAVAKGLCSYVDFTPINKLTSPAGKPSVESYHRGFEGATNVLYVCHGYTGNVLVRNIEVMVYDSVANAAVAYVQDKSYSRTVEPIQGISEDAYGWVFDPETYVVQALHNNITLKIVLLPRNGWKPDLTKERTVEITTIKGILAKLPYH